jgi:hypothetical protein
VVIDCAHFWTVGKTKFLGIQIFEPTRLLKARGWQLL